MKLMLDWLMDHMRVKWSYASMEYGTQCVEMSGTSMMLKLCVDNWDMMDVSTILWFSSTCNLLHHSISASHLLLYSASSSFNLENVDCRGNESKLSDCKHSGVGVHHCSTIGGVNCNCRFCYPFLDIMLFFLFPYQPH